MNETISLSCVIQTTSCDTLKNLLESNPSECMLEFPRYASATSLDTGGSDISDISFGTWMLFRNTLHCIGRYFFIDHFEDFN